jgi:hypothetical protein
MHARWMGLLGVALAACDERFPKPYPDAAPIVAAPPVLGGRIAYAGIDALRGDAGLMVTHIYSFVLGDPEAKPVRLTDGDARDSLPAWSLDGSRIAYVHSPAVGLAELFAMNADGSGGAALGPCVQGCNTPVYAADGNVWFVSFDDLSGEIRVVPAAGGAPPVRRWANPDPDHCVISAIATTRDGARIASVVDDRFLPVCPAAIRGLHMAKLDGADLGPLVTPSGAATDAIHTVFFGESNDRVFFVTAGTELYSSWLDGTEARAELALWSPHAVAGMAGDSFALVVDENDAGFRAHHSLSAVPLGADGGAPIPLAGVDPLDVGTVGAGSIRWRP